MKYLAVIVLCFSLTTPVFAQLDLDMQKASAFRPASHAVIAMQMATLPCILKSEQFRGDLGLSKYGITDNRRSWNALVVCVSTQKLVPKEKLISALKSLSEKPAVEKALKDYYLKWLASLDALVPQDDRTPIDNAALGRAESSLAQSQKALELEIELDR